MANENRYGAVPLSEGELKSIKRSAATTPKAQAIMQSPFLAQNPFFSEAYRKTEKRIGESTQAVKAATKEFFSSRKETRRPGESRLKEFAMAPPRAVLSLLGATVPRAEAAVANPMLAMQEGRFGPRELVRESLKGLTAERVGQIGDVARRSAMWPEWMSAGAGMIGMTAVTKGVTAVARGLMRWSGKLKPTIMNDAWLEGQAVKAKDAVESSRTALRTQYKKALNPAQRARPVDQRLVKAALKELPDDMADDLGVGGKFNIDKKRALDTVDDIWDFRDDIIQNDINTASWTRQARYGERAKETQEILMKTASKLKRVVLRSVDDETAAAIKELDPKYTTIMKEGKGVIDMVYDPVKNLYKTSSLRSTFSSAGRAGERQMLRRVSKLARGLEEVEADLIRYTKHQGFKAALGRAAPQIGRGAATGAGAVGGGYLAGSLIADALRE